MMVECVANDLEMVKLDAVRRRLGQSIHIDGPIRDLIVGKQYKVRAVEYRDRGCWLFIHTVAANDYPYPYPAEYFELTDGAVPPSWAIKFSHDEDGVMLKRLSFSEWASDDSFYERLVEGDADAVALYEQRS